MMLSNYFLESTELFCCLFMFGVIVFVQVVHYPLLAAVGKERFSLYQNLHQKKISLVVILPMVLELFSAILLQLVQANLGIQDLIKIALLGIIWCSTFFLQVPLHYQLEKNGYNKAIIYKLCCTNWVRTIAWGIRSVLLISA